MRCMQRFLTLWVSLLAIQSVQAQPVYISHCLRACPDVSHPETEVVVRHLYAAAIDPDSGLAEWVAYRVLPDSVGVASLLPRYWQADELVSTSSIEVEEGSGPALVQPDLSEAQDREYRINETSFDTGDQGRLAPMTSFAGTPYWDELNNLSNMSPLPQSLRLGSWSRLDQAINELTAQLGELYVVSGPVYSYSGTQSDSLVPGSYFKLVSDGESVATFLFSNTLPVHAEYCDQLVSLSQVETQLDRQLLPGLRGLNQQSLQSVLGCHR